MGKRMNFNRKTDGFFAAPGAV